MARPRKIKLVMEVLRKLLYHKHITDVFKLKGMAEIPPPVIL